MDIKEGVYKYFAFAMLSQIHKCNAIDLIGIPITFVAMAYVINVLYYIVA